VINTGEMNKKVLVSRSSNKQQVKEFVSQVTEFRIGAGNLVNLYNHHAYLVNGSDFYEKINEYLNPSESISLDDKGSSNYFDTDKTVIHKDPFEAIEGSLSILFKSIGKFLSNIYESFFFKFLYLVLFLFVFLFVFYYFIHVKKSKLLQSKFRNCKIDKNALNVDEIGSIMIA
jgi:hypothetical protein